MSTNQDHLHPRTTPDLSAPAYLAEKRYLKELVPLSTTVHLCHAAEITTDPVMADLLREVERSMLRLRDHLSGRPIRSTYAQLKAELALLASTPPKLTDAQMQELLTATKAPIIPQS